MSVMKRIVFIVVFAVIFAVNSSADAWYLFDDANCLTETMRGAYELKLKETSEELGFPVAVLITDDIGSDKSDYGAMDYADVYQENKFGINADGIMLMISLDPSNRYYYITTSGSCISRFTDAEIDEILDAVENSYGGKMSYDKTRLGTGITSFAAAVSRYSGYGGSVGSVSVGGIVGGWGMFIVIIDAIAVVCFVVGVKKRYKIYPARGAGNYLDPASVRYYQKSDTYIRTYVTKVRIQSSSGGHGGSSHHSSGGGSHGGGGRH